jgi:lysine-N-methylase
MRTTLPHACAYPTAFRCIGSYCEDSCCQGWNVPIDQVTYEKYKNLPATPLGKLISESIVTTPVNAAEETATGEDASTRNADQFARVCMDGTNRCPLLTSERLCRIHAELGEQMLSYTCSTYPRIVHDFGSVTETALALSCPEAARLVLLTPDLLKGTFPSATPSNPQLPPEEQTSAEPAPRNADEGAAQQPPHFLAIRQSVLSLVQLRSYPLWQRMFLLGLLCRRLDSIARGELNRSVPGFLADFKTAVATGSLRPAMETLPVDRAAQLDVVLRLAGLMLHRSNVSPRFAAAVQAFTAGIGNGPGATLETLTTQYAQAHDLSFEPFFRHYPHIFENYLVNTIVRCQFPFGREGVKAGALPNRTREFASLTAQFALIRGLLIGVAGFHRAAFSTAHVVATVQSAAKHFEHHPEFLKLSYELLLESRMDGPRGMAILLRNTGQESNTAVLPGPHAPSPQLSAPFVKPIV